MDINKTQLSPAKTFERHVYHRDLFAHYLRWTYVLRLLRRDMKILDLGCGSAELLKVIYHNMYKAKRYLGVDIRKITIEKNRSIKTNFETGFKTLNLIKDKLPYDDWDIITCFEVLEHNESIYIHNILKNIKNVMHDDTILLISTPNFNGKKAANHVHEYEFEELKMILEKYFTIKKIYGTFISKKDLLQAADDDTISFYNKAMEYHDVNILSILFAFDYPLHSRNCLWVLKSK